MKTTYKAMQITQPGKLELVEREVVKPGSGEVLIRVDACGICGADTGAIEGREPGIQYPRVPGHEIIGRIEALGAGVSSHWSIGQRVGVGRLGGHCNECVQCRRGEFHLCQNQPVMGSSHDGGYAEMVIAKSTGLVAVPDELNSAEAAPILCAGIATFNALKKSGAQAGEVVAIQGIGGLGHLAIQYARKMGFKVVAVGRGSDIAETASTLGAHVYIDSRSEDAAARLQAMGGADVIVSTITDSGAVSSLLPALTPHGRLIVVGVAKDPIGVLPGHLVRGERSIQGTITGTPYENEKTLDFSVLTDVRPMIETMPLEKAVEAYQKMASGEAKFRMVLTMNNNG